METITMSRLKLLSVVALATALTACNDDDDDNTVTPAPEPTPVVGQGQLRVTHASPDAPTVNVYVNGSVALSAVDYKQSSGYITLDEGDIDVEVKGILPDGSELSVIGPVSITIAADKRTDVVAWDNLLDGDAVNIKAAVLNNDIVDITQVQASVLHAAPQVADVDIYVTTPDGALMSATPIDAGFGDFAGPLDLMADTEYRVRITPDGSDTVVYDSGTVSFTAGTEVMLVAVENTTGIGDNPVNLLAVNSTGAAEVFDSNTGAEIRVVHNVADAPAVDILVNGAEALNAVSYKASSMYGDVAAPAGTYDITVAADADNTIAPINAPVTVEQGKSYTIVAVGGLNSVTDETIEPLITVDNRRSVATQASLRVIHGSYAVAESIPVDVYLTPTADITGATPAITGLAYGSATDELPVGQGDYYVTVTAAGDASTVALATGPLTLNAGTNYTVIARDPDMSEMGAPLILATILAE